MNSSYKYSLLLAHGWGCSGLIWRDWAALFPEARLWPLDLGFFGAPYPESVELDAWPSSLEAELAVAGLPIVAVGHSLGFLWLLKNWPAVTANKLLALVSIGGFARFTADSDFTAGVPPLLLRRMISRFAKDSAATCEDFFTRCGQPPPDWNSRLAALPAGAESLAAGLNRLAEWDERSRLAELAATSPLLILSAADDQIVSPAMSAATFAGHDAKMVIAVSGGHALPWSNSRFCAAALRNWLGQQPGFQAVK